MACLRAAWKDEPVPKPYPAEFRDDVVRVARNREPGVTIEQIAKDFGVHPMTLQKWLSRAEIDDGVKPGQTRTEAVELREARKRIRLLEQEVEVLRRAAAYLSEGESAEKRTLLCLAVKPSESEAPERGTGRRIA